MEAVTSALGIILGMSMIILGSFQTWRCDGALGAWLLRRVFYTVAIAISVATLLLAVYETLYLVTRPGITGPGIGIHLICGGSVAAFFYGLCGYSLLEKRSETP